MFGTFGRRLKELLSDRRGNIALVVAAVFPMIIGAAGLAIDGTEWILQKRQMQAAADGAAMAGVYGIITTQDMQGAVDHSIAQSSAVPANAKVDAIQGPPGRENDPFAVNVRISAPATMIFSSMFMKQPPVIVAESTASVVENGHYCAFALGSTRDEAGLVLRPNSNVQVDCGVTTNSQSSNALETDGTSTLNALALRAYGAFTSPAAQTAIIKSGVRERALKQDDPLSGMDPPQVPNTGCPDEVVNPGEKEVTIDPGCYGNLSLNGDVRLQDGEYILNEGNFVVGPQGHVECDACTIFLTSQDAATAGWTIGKVKISSEATVKMNASREGPNAGILFYQDRHAPSEQPGDENRLGGNSFSKLNGLIYFPSQTVYIDGNENADVQCTRFIARRLIFAGRVYIGKSCDGLDKVTFAATEVRLIG